MSKPASTLHRLVYRSRNAMTGSEVAIEQGIGNVLQTSRRNNAESQVTGALLTVGGVFLQALEGSSAALEATFERICCDLRHIDIELIEFAPINETIFGGWDMHLLQPKEPLRKLVQQLDAADGARDSRTTAEAVRLMAAMIALEGGRATVRSAGGAGSEPPELRDSTGRPAGVDALSARERAA